MEVRSAADRDCMTAGATQAMLPIPGPVHTGCSTCGLHCLLQDLLLVMGAQQLSCAPP